MGIFDKIKKAVFGNKTAEEELKKDQKTEDQLPKQPEEPAVPEQIEIPKEEPRTPEVEEIKEPLEEVAPLEVEEIKEPLEEVAPLEVEEIKEPLEEVAPLEVEEIKEPLEEPGTPVEEVSPLKVEVVEKPKEELTPLEVEATEEIVEVIPVEVKEEVIETTTEKYDKGLAKSRRTFGQFMNELFSNFRMVDDEFFEELEEALISSDVGFDMAMSISDELQEEVKLRNVKKAKDIERTIVEKLVERYDADGENENNEINLQADGPTIILFVGVNGVGKTTSIGKMAHQYRQAGKKVLLAAADTFRAGAIDQLVVWGERAGVEVVCHAAGSDPAAVVYDAVEKTKKEGYDVLLVDTAGRLQNKVNLMKELEKMKRVIEREYPSAPHEVLLVVDATTGQNALIQAKQFKETTDVTGIVLSKLDGTAKGGIVLAIRHELKLPVKLVGMGEGINDLHPFDPDQFVYGLFKDVIENYE
ncbi:signal recognition particle-docking protein FtsY [Vagococcus sp.]|uniref:signal recognition particle-docking protein FtsY n=1 Tax=Vagococcus sp. TaxID=1933889 RepID=UPI003F9E67C6